MRLQARILCTLIFLCPAISAASTPADLAALASDPEWLALLHVNRGSTLHNRGESYVDDDAFFLAPDGDVDFLAELNATITAVAAAHSPTRCRFPARYQFLVRRLAWPDDGGLSHCDELQHWLAHIPNQRAVLVFPASYLNSPSSMFGHTLLRLDDSKNPDSVWHSWAVNFGAAIAPDDNSIVYVYRGLAGGYPGQFVIVPYVTKIQEYSHMENRDMWEYTLNLNSEQIERMNLHVWELRGINFDYYFLDENCSFRLLELIDVAQPGISQTDGLRLAEPPVNTVRALYKANLISGRIYRPSKAVQIESERQQLSDAEQRLVKQLIADPAIASSDTFLAYPESQRHLMALLAYQILRFEHRKEDRSQDVAHRSMALLNIVNRNPGPADYPVITPPPPEDGHGTQMLSIGGGQEDSNDFGEIGYRFTYHDWIDRNQGFLKGAQIEAADIRLRSTDSGSLKLQSADLVHIRSLSARNELIKPLSWFVQGGLERAEADNQEKLVRFVQGGPGLAWQADNLMPYAFITARLENNSVYSPFLEPGAGAQAGLLWYLPYAEINIGSDGTYFANDDYRYRYFTHINIPISRQSAIRLEWQHKTWRGDHEDEVSLTWRQFFD
ncbi:MAG TPA: DUF4105 domain-containing protein [Pseudomonadales bacterium]|jgi:hypothetical protein